MTKNRTRALVAFGAVVATIAAGALPAGAHVEIVPGRAAKGSTAILSLNVPNENETANTVTVEVDLPTKYPIASVHTQPMPGWTVAVKKTKLAKPVTTDDGQVTEAVSTITWTATAGGLNPGEFDLFTISAGPLPTTTNRLVFKAIQTYSDGSVVSWIQLTAKGAAEPEHPAPVLVLTKAGSTRH
jgi:uncharacterized protein YcnI